MNKIILALDTTNLAEAIDITQRVKNKIFTIKLGLEFFNAHGKNGIKKFNELGITNLMLEILWKLSVSQKWKTVPLKNMLSLHLSIIIA